MSASSDDSSSRAPSLRTSPLHDRHVSLGAKFAEFGGWSMPLEYAGSGVVKEHTAVRQAVGIFDVSHLGKGTVRGPGAAAFVNATLSNDLGKIAPGRAQYTLCCDAQTGGIVDDLIAHLHSDDHVFLVPNAANTSEGLRRPSGGAPAGGGGGQQPGRPAGGAGPGRGGGGGGWRWPTSMRAMRCSPSRAAGPTACWTRWVCRPVTTTCRSWRRTSRVRRLWSAGRATPANAATSWSARTTPPVRCGMR